MIDLHIVLGISAELAGESQHACVLAGAVIVNLKRLAAILDGLVMRLDFDGPMGAALVLILLVLGLFQHGAGDVDMRGLATVGGAGERQLLLTKAKVISRAGLDQRHTLKGLDGRARENGRFDIAGGFEHPALAIHHAESPRVAAFNNAPAGDFGNDRIWHVNFLY